MSTDLVVFDEKKLELIKNMFAKNATNDEFTLFVNMAERLQLDPILKQIYFIKFGSNMSIIVGIDGYRLIADRTNRYMPGRESTFNYDKNGDLFSATSYVKKLGPDGQWHEFAATAIRKEYDTGKNNWVKGPHYMLAKCAESLALRKGWPSEFSGTNTEEEMSKVIVDAEYEEVKKTFLTKTEEPKQLGESTKNFMSIDQIQELDDLIAGDVKYKETLINSYKQAGWKVNSLFDIPASHFSQLKVKIEANNKNRNFMQEAVNV